MPVEIRCEVTPYGFVPVGDEDRYNHSLLKVGSTIRGMFTRHKSRPMERFYWALVTKVADGIGDDKQCLSDDLLRRTKRIDSWELPHGHGLRIKVKSIAKMSHMEFREYVDSAIGLILADYLPGMRRSDLIQEVEKMTGISYAETSK